MVVQSRFKALPIALKEALSSSSFSICCRSDNERCLCVAMVCILPFILEQHRHPTRSAYHKMRTHLFHGPIYMGPLSLWTPFFRQKERGFLWRLSAAKILPEGQPHINRLSRHKRLVRLKSTPLFERLNSIGRIQRVEFTFAIKEFSTHFILILI